MAKRINYEGDEGVFLSESEWQKLVADVEAQNNQIRALTSELDRARTEAKYKLKKMRKIIERKKLNSRDENL
ncbi:hypothetical protein [Pseudoalteromonas xiamenensis]|uniref:Uncharacterized protein n=1 Tax=Pseudoalteromonas xiamenensis TaxID=882626 RepID=A0A975DIM6_9GAMM|nr:hypothetical protein [Pseudoalteromonas xiamenensis]QTH72314.1 hypothetical protein J5O05_05475 [Pseudoalteromonas xiamenensis]